MIANTIKFGYRETTDELHSLYWIVRATLNVSGSITLSFRAFGEGVEAPLSDFAVITMCNLRAARRVLADLSGFRLTDEKLTDAIAKAMRYEANLDAFEYREKLRNAGQTVTPGMHSHVG